MVLQTKGCAYRCAKQKAPGRPRDLYPAYNLVDHRILVAIQVQQKDGITPTTATEVKANAFSSLSQTSNKSAVARNPVMGEINRIVSLLTLPMKGKSSKKFKNAGSSPKR
jgi:hypothetical protein